MISVSSQINRSNKRHSIVAVTGRRLAGCLPRICLVALVATWLVCPVVVFAQDNGGDGGGGGDLIIGDSTGISTGQPRDNVGGGALSERRPGLWTETSIGRHIAYQTNSLKDFGGATFVPEDSLPPEPYKVFLIAVLEGVNDLIQQFSDLISLMRPPQPVPV